MSLYSRLEPLRIYALHQNSLIDCELVAYEVALNMLNTALNNVILGAFVQTATGKELVLHEKLVGFHERPGVNLDTRRSLVLYRHSVAPFDFNLSGMKNSMLAAGLEADIVENPENESIKIISKRLFDDFNDLDSVKVSLANMLPSHLDSEFDIGFMTWDMFNSYDISWDAWDSINFTWEKFDIDAGKLFL